MRRLPLTCLALLALVAATALAPLPAAGALVATGPSACDVAGTAAASPQSRLGVLAAIGCGFFCRATVVTAGTQVGTIVGAVACCGYMLFDAFTDVSK
jgi:hypothetical protein